MAKVCPLFSGSSGNSTYISCSEGGILIDAGVSAKAITEALQWHDVPVDTIRAIFVTHEHGDHVSGIRVFVSAQNWLTFTKYNGVDPEVSSKASDVNAGIDHLTYPNSKTISMGLSVKF